MIVAHGSVDRGLSSTATSSFAPVRAISFSLADLYSCCPLPSPFQICARKYFSPYLWKINSGPDFPSADATAIVYTVICLSPSTSRILWSVPAPVGTVSIWYRPAGSVLFPASNAKGIFANTTRRCAKHTPAAVIETTERNRHCQSLLFHRILLFLLNWSGVARIRAAAILAHRDRVSFRVLANAG